MTSQTPAALGYRMPAEWEPHAATWLSWPRPEGISFPDSFDRVMPTLRAMIEALIESERVCINVCNGAHEAEARQVVRGLSMERISFHLVPTNEPWCRDHGPIFLTRDRKPKLAVADWDYNAWGNKYPPFDLDGVVPTRLAQLLNVPVFYPRMILEGGAIEVNGAAALLTTESCLLNANRRSQDRHRHFADAEKDRARRAAASGELRELLYRKHLRPCADVCGSKRRSGIIDFADAFSKSSRHRDRFPRTNLGPWHISLPDP